MPITAIANVKVATFLSMAGNRGTGYEGKTAVADLARMVARDQICKQSILLPMVSCPTAEAGLRCAPAAPV